MIYGYLKSFPPKVKIEEIAKVFNELFIKNPNIQMRKYDLPACKQEVMDPILMLMFYYIAILPIKQNKKPYPPKAK